MATSDSVNERAAPLQPLIGSALTLSAAAEMMLAASRNMMAASGGAFGSEARARDSLAEAVESGLLRALRRQSLLGDEAGEGFAGGLRLPRTSSGNSTPCIRGVSTTEGQTHTMRMSACGSDRHTSSRSVSAKDTTAALVAL